MLGDGVVGSFPSSHRQYRSYGLPGRSGPAAGLKRRGTVSLCMWNPERGREVGSEGEGEWESPVGAYDGRAIWDAKTSESKDWRT